MIERTILIISVSLSQNLEKTMPRGEFEGESNRDYRNGRAARGQRAVQKTSSKGRFGDIFDAKRTGGERTSSLRERDNSERYRGTLRNGQGGDGFFGREPENFDKDEHTSQSRKNPADKQRDPVARQVSESEEANQKNRNDADVSPKRKGENRFGYQEQVPSDREDFNESDYNGAGYDSSVPDGEISDRRNEENSQSGGGSVTRDHRRDSWPRGTDGGTRGGHYNK